MKLKLLVPILFFTISGCTQNQSLEGTRRATSPVEQTQVSFQTYAENVPPVKLPVAIACDNALPVAEVAFSEKLIAAFGPENAHVHGLLADKEKFTAIIYLVPADIMLPVIQTSDKSGAKISDLPLFDQWCGEDEFSWGTSRAEITKDLTIVLSDSVIRYQRDDAGEIVEATRKAEVRHRTFFIGETGRITEKH